MIAIASSDAQDEFLVKLFKISLNWIPLFLNIYVKLWYSDLYDIFFVMLARNFCLLPLMVSSMGYICSWSIKPAV